MATKIVRSGPPMISIGGDKIITGTWFTGRIHSFAETLFLKGGCEIIGWTNDGNCTYFNADVVIENYRPVDIEIKVL